MQTQPQRQLSLFDSTCIIVGIIIGAGIYAMAPQVAKGGAAIGDWLNENLPALGLEASRWLGVLSLWLLGGLISRCGALGYAELATAWPMEGGDYVYLSRAYGRWAGFLFAWIQLTIVRPGDIAVMAFAFAIYAQKVWNPLARVGVPEAYTPQIYAAAAVVVLTAINIVGVRQGKWTQNLLTSVKVIGLALIVAAAVFAAPGAERPESFEALPVSLALVLVLFTYGGWNEMAYVAAEVKNPRKNITRALVLGTVAVMGLYILVNGAFLYSLGYEPTAGADAVAAQVVGKVLPRTGAALVSALVCISALGAVNGLIFTGARITYAMGTEHRLFGALGRWHGRTGTPLPALLAQGVIALVMIVALGGLVETLLYAAPAVYLFYLGTTLSVLVLRFKEPGVERPYRMTLFPVPVILFAGVCGYLIYSCIQYARATRPGSLIVLGVTLLVGLLLYVLSRLTGTSKPAPETTGTP